MINTNFHSADVFDTSSEKWCVLALVRLFTLPGLTFNDGGPSSSEDDSRK